MPFQVQGLQGLSHHSQVEPDIGKRRLHREGARPGILSQGADQDQACGLEPLLAQGSQLGRRTLKLFPGQFTSSTQRARDPAKLTPLELKKVTQQVLLDAAVYHEAVGLWSI